MRQVELKRHPTYRGARWIMVDAVLWGFIAVRGHGCWGNEYTFHQVTAPDPLEWDLSPLTRDGHKVNVRSARGERRYGSREALVPVEQRLQLEASKLVADGLLRHPVLVQEDLQVAHKRHIESLEREEAVRQEELRKMAKAVMLMIQPGRPYIAVEVENAIVEAMRWAQRQ